MIQQRIQVLRDAGTRLNFRSDRYTSANQIKGASSSSLRNENIIYSLILSSQVIISPVQLQSKNNEPYSDEIL